MDNVIQSSLPIHPMAFTSSADSVQVYAPDGTCLGKILVSETVANLTFGGHRRDRLVIAAGQFRSHLS